MKQLITLMLACTAVVTSCQTEDKDYTRHVNLFIGTGGHGHTHPAAVVPHGMVQPGPDTRWYQWDACSGYHYSDTTINGFAYTRLSGTGCADLGDFLIMPTSGAQQTAYDVTPGDGHQQMPWASTFSHQDETATPGYYAVTLQRYGIRAEMTATERAAIHRFTYPEGENAGLILDLGYSIQDQEDIETDVEVVDNQTIRAYRRSYWWAYDQRLHYYAKFSTPFTHSYATDSVTIKGKQVARKRVLLQFPDGAGKQVMVRASISAVDAAGAERNLSAEIPDWDFEGVRQAAHAKWQKELSKIDITPTGENAENELAIFYTALYHTAISPAIYSDADGRYRGMDLNIHQTDPKEPNYTVFSLWDTFRALHPLVSILTPEQNETYIRALLRMADEGGAMPKWPLASNYTSCMIGYHFASLAADAYAKGYRNFDLKKALDACIKVAEGDTTGMSPTVPKYKINELMPPARRLKNEFGYVPCDKDNESVAKALEYAYDDWCISALAEALGEKETAEKYRNFAQGYQRYFDPSIRFMRGVDSKGEWRTPFDPRRSEHRADDYCEGNAWQWTWFAPHDVEGLITLMGGKQAFTEKLDSLFSAPSEITGDLISSDISGLIGQYAHGNEPGHHIIYLYNYAGRPERTQELCDSVLRTLYANAPEGLAGNEDCGQMSAWYVLSSMGIYQVCPGKPVWTIGRPMFNKATMQLPNGRTFTIEATGNSAKAKYIKSIELNGKPLEEPFISHEDIANGGTLKLTMSEKP